MNCENTNIYKVPLKSDRKWEETESKKREKKKKQPNYKGRDQILRIS